MPFYTGTLYFPVMKTVLSFLIPVLLFTACSAPASPTAEPVLPAPSPTRDPLLITPVESAFAPGDPTAAPIDDILAKHAVTFETPDGATITGELYGTGNAAVIFSVMGNCKPGWREFAQLTAAQGLVTLTYQWRGCRESGTVDAAELGKFVDDLRGAINFMRGRGATKLILAGASLGGCASAKLTVESQADGLIVMASPPEISEFRFAVEAPDINSGIPKLFITAEKDNIVPLVISQQLFEIAADPKEWQTYPGVAHGTDLFDTEYGEEVQQRILGFILAVANP